MPSRNLEAFLTMIAESEGTNHIGDRGYNCIVGSTINAPDLFHSYADHPRKKVLIKKLGIFSTAAGRYQILARYYDHYKTALDLPDFSPESQDKIATQLIKECGALADVERGDIESAVKKCKSRWASLPDAGYGQHEHKIGFLVDAYRKAGGVMA